MAPVMSDVLDAPYEAAVLEALGEASTARLEEPNTARRMSWKYVAILGGLMALGPLSMDMYLPALPAVGHDLHASQALTQITLMAFILGMAIGQVVIGPLSDARGRKGPLLIGIAVYLVASLLCAVAPSVWILVALRFVQGFAGGAGVIALAIARDLFDGVALSRSVSLLMTVTFLGPIVAPVIGGQLLQFTSWHGVFVTQAVCSAVALVAAALWLRETLEPGRRQSGDLAATLGSFRQALANRNFLGYTLASSLVFAGLMIYISAAPFALETIYHLSPENFGLLFGVNAIGLAGANLVSGRLVGRVAPQRLMFGGMIVLALASLVFLVDVITGVGFVAVAPLLFVFVTSAGFILPNADALGLSVSDPRIAGSASGVMGLIQLALGAVLAPLVGLAGTQTATPMALSMVVGSLLGLLTYIAFFRRPTARGQLKPRLNV